MEISLAFRRLLVSAAFGEAVVRGESGGIVA